MATIDECLYQVHFYQARLSKWRFRLSRPHHEPDSNELTLLYKDRFRCIELMLNY